MTAKKVLPLFIIGGIGYCLIEIIVRGYTHWSMGLAGGICFVCLYLLYEKMGGANILLKCAAGALMITGVELAAGVVFNLWLGMEVWCYSEELLNLYGQICPLYSFYWFLLCIPIMVGFSLPQALAALRFKRRQ
ncbi:MAG: hypothetical protein RR814_07645 [Oscillospiraceae bacterium]